LQRSERLVRISLRRLDLEEISILARRAAPAYAFPLAGWLNRNSEGVPLVIVELLQYARENNLLTSRGAVDLSALSGSPAVPPTVYSLIRNRLGRISEPARRILDAAVAFGREFEFDIVARAAVLSEDAALDALDELRSSGLIHPAGAARFAFGHNLLMEVAYLEVGEPRHLLLHRRIAEAMESLYQPGWRNLLGSWLFTSSRRAVLREPRPMPARLGTGRGGWLPGARLLISMHRLWLARQ
jgi:hypothetical protein